MEIKMQKKLYLFIIMPLMLSCPAPGSHEAVLLDTNEGTTGNYTFSQGEDPPTQLYKNA